MSDNLLFMNNRYLSKGSAYKISLKMFTFWLSSPRPLPPPKFTFVHFALFPLHLPTCARAAPQIWRWRSILWKVGDQYSKNTQIWKRWGLHDPSLRSYGGAAAALADVSNRPEKKFNFHISCKLTMTMHYYYYVEHSLCCLHLCRYNFHYYLLPTFILKFQDNIIASVSD